MNPFLPAAIDDETGQFNEALEAQLATVPPSHTLPPEVTRQTREEGRGIYGPLQIDEQADTDEPSYYKQTSKKTTLLVGAASEVFVGNGSVKYQSAVACQRLR